MEFTLTRKSAKTPATTFDPTTLVPLATNFDYLNGAFARAERGRQMVLVITMLGVLFSSALLFAGIQSKQAAADDLGAAHSAGTTSAEVQKQLNELDQAGGIPADTLRSHTQRRFTVYKRAVSTEVDVARLVNQLNSVAPNGVTLSAIKLAAPTEDKASGPAAGAPSGSASPAAPATPAAGGTGGGTGGTTGGVPAGQYTLTLTGTAASFTTIGEWSAALTRVPGLINPQPSWTGGGTDLTVTIVATLSPALYTQRANDAARADAFGLVSPATLPGSTPGTLPNTVPGPNGVPGGPPNGRPSSPGNPHSTPGANLSGTQSQGR